MKNKQDTMKISNLEDIKRYEHVSNRASKLYVPIKTSDFVQYLSQDFLLSHGAQYRKGSTGHYVEMVKNDKSGVSLYIENSFDRTCALRMAFNYRGFIFGRIKQIHRGQPAHEMIGSIADINKWYKNAIQSIENMKRLSLTRDDMKAIAEMTFKTRGVHLSMITNISYKHNNALDFVMYLVEGIKNGVFVRTSTTGTKALKPLTQASLIVQMNNKIWNFLAKNNPELYV